MQRFTALALAILVAGCGVQQQAGRGGGRARRSLDSPAAIERVLPSCPGATWEDIEAMLTVFEAFPAAGIPQSEAMTAGVLDYAATYGRAPTSELINCVDAILDEVYGRR